MSYALFNTIMNDYYYNHSNSEIERRVERFYELSSQIKKKIHHHRDPAMAVLIQNFSLLKEMKEQYDWILGHSFNYFRMADLRWYYLRYHDLLDKQMYKLSKYYQMLLFHHNFHWKYFRNHKLYTLRKPQSFKIFGNLIDEITEENDFTLETPQYFKEVFTPHDDIYDGKERYKEYVGDDCFLDCDDVNPYPYERYDEEYVEISDDEYAEFIIPLSQSSLIFFSSGYDRDMLQADYYYKKKRIQKMYDRICGFNIQLFNDFSL